MTCDHPLDGHTQHGPWCQPAPRYPFTEPERAALGDAYRALTRVGNATSTDARPWPEWDDYLDRAQHGLALVMIHAGIPLDAEREVAEPEAPSPPV